MNKMEKMEQLRNKNGITLISLVITIIILIILAGVSINILFDDEGIIRTAKRAAENMEIAQLEEQERINELLDELGGRSTSTIKPGEGGDEEENNTPTEPEGPVVIEGPVAGGSYDNPYIPTGFTHIEGDGTWNSGYIITETETGNKFVWVPCVLNQTKVKTGDNVVNFGRTLPSTTEETDPYYMYNKADIRITGEEDLASDIKVSVGTYGGFYIAAYEAGVPLNEYNQESLLPQVTEKARSVEGATAWTDITRTDAITAAENMIDSSIAGVNSGLISGECWDTTLKWMVTTSDNATNEPNLGYDTNSDGKGYYEQGIKTTTGQWQINNIYDMAGNVTEWTTENGMYYGDGYFISHGGDYRLNGFDFPAAYRIGNEMDDTGYHIGFRVVLYK